MTPTISVTGLSRHYRGHTALGEVSLTVEPGTVTGLLGRNGAGKTTLMRIITGLEFPTPARSGCSVLSRRRTSGAAPHGLRARRAGLPGLPGKPRDPGGLMVYPNWSAELAEQLLADFELPLSQRIRRLCGTQERGKGQEGRVGERGNGAGRKGTRGLRRQEVSCLTRVWRTRRAPAHHRAAHPPHREVADLLEHVVMLDHGRVALDAPAEELRGTAMTVSGLAIAVEELWAARCGTGAHRLACLGRRAGPARRGRQARARALHLSLEPLSLQQLLVHASGVAAEEKVSA